MVLFVIKIVFNESTSLVYSKQSRGFHSMNQLDGKLNPLSSLEISSSVRVSSALRITTSGNLTSISVEFVLVAFQDSLIQSSAVVSDRRKNVPKFFHLYESFLCLREMRRSFAIDLSRNNERRKAPSCQRPALLYEEYSPLELDSSVLAGRVSFLWGGKVWRWTFPSPNFLKSEIAPLWEGTIWRGNLGGLWISGLRRPIEEKPSIEWRGITGKLSFSCSNFSSVESEGDTVAFRGGDNEVNFWWNTGHWVRQLVVEFTKDGKLLPRL